MRRLIVGSLALVLLSLVATWQVGSSLTAPAPAAFRPPEGLLPLDDVELASESGARIRGWFLSGTPGRGAVLLMHGVRANRLSMASRAAFLRRAGFSVLLIDLQAHGESSGPAITFGHLEALDARAATAHLRTRLPSERIGALGSSLGGAAAVLGSPALEVHALALEAVYPNVENAIANRLEIRLGPAGRWLTPLFSLQLRLRLGIPAGALAPVEGIRAVRCPVLVVAGALDRRTSSSDTDALFAAVTAPKELWVIPGAAHVDFHRFAPAEYERRIETFFAAHLRRH